MATPLLKKSRAEASFASGADDPDQRLAVGAHHVAHPPERAAASPAGPPACGAAAAPCPMHPAREDHPRPRRRWPGALAPSKVGEVWYHVALAVGLLAPPGRTWSTSVSGRTVTPPRPAVRSFRQIQVVADRGCSWRRCGSRSCTRRRSCSRCAPAPSPAEVRDRAPRLVRLPEEHRHVGGLRSGLRDPDLVGDLFEDPVAAGEAWDWGAAPSMVRAVA
jgi:hypothetical protein